MGVGQNRDASDGLLRPAPQVVYRTVDDEAILLDPTSGRYYSLDEVGSRAWALLDQYGALDPVIETLLLEYEVERDRLAGDLEVLVEQLLERGLLLFATDMG